MARMRRRRVGHGAKARQGGDETGWERDISAWNAEFMAAFTKARVRRTSVPELEAADEDDARKAALLVAAKAEKLGIKGERAGKLAAMLADDFRDARVQLMLDLVRNPKILEAARTVWLEKGEGASGEEEEDHTEEGEEAGSNTEGQEVVEGGAEEASAGPGSSTRAVEEAAALEGEPTGE